VKNPQDLQRMLHDLSQDAGYGPEID
jgi:hypothetical protein